MAVSIRAAFHNKGARARLFTFSQVAGGSLLMN
jgi:hypothetical protein